MTDNSEDLWAPHGRWRLRVLGQLLIYEASGGWNEQGAALFCRAARRAAADLVGTRWAVFGNLLDWDLATPEAIEMMRRLTFEAVNAGCVLETLVGGDNELTRYCIDRIVPPTLPGFERVLANSVDEATRELAGLGFIEEAQVLADRGLERVIGEGLAEQFD